MLWGLASSIQRALVMIGTVYLITAVAIGAVLCIVSFFFVRLAAEFFRLRRPALVVCPKSGDFAVVRIDALHAAVTGILNGAELCVSACSRWPERHGCDQGCMR